MQRLLVFVFLFAAVLLMGAFSLAGCGDKSASNEIRIQATSKLPEGANVDGKTVEGQALLITDTPNNTLGENCPNETQHRGQFTTKLDSNGSFNLNLRPDDFTPVSHPDCGLTGNSQIKFRVLRLSLNLPELNLRGTARADEGRLTPTDGGGWNTNLEVSFEPVPAASAEGQPDLVVNEKAPRDSWAIETKTIPEDSCAVKEGCLSATGERRLLTFDSAIVNTGTAPLVIGDPAQDENSEFDSCHQHHHLGNAMRYELRSSNGTLLATGRKQGFCLMDSSRVTGDLPGPFDCENQGISSGWEDVYDRALDCQWIDVTDVPPGDYLLRLTANPDFVFEESNLSNNSVEIPVTVPAR